MDEENKYKVLGYKLGVIFLSTVSACFTAVVIAVTLKFIFWLF